MNDNRDLTFTGVPGVAGIVLEERPKEVLMIVADAVQRFDDSTGASGE